MDLFFRLVPGNLHPGKTDRINKINRIPKSFADPVHSVILSFFFVAFVYISGNGPLFPTSSGEFCLRMKWTGLTGSTGWTGYPNASPILSSVICPLPSAIPAEDTEHGLARFSTLKPE